MASIRPVGASEDRLLSMFIEPLVIDFFAPKHPDAEKDGPHALRVEVLPESLNQWAAELQWDTAPTVSAQTALDAPRPDHLRRLLVLRAIKDAVLLFCEDALLAHGLRVSEDLAPLSAQPSPDVAEALAWARGTGPLPGLGLVMAKDASAQWEAPEWPARGAEAAKSLARAFAQEIPGPAAQPCNAYFCAAQMDHTLAAYEPEEIVRKCSKSMCGFALLFLAAYTIARQEALDACHGDALIAQGPLRPMDNDRGESLASLSKGALLRVECDAWPAPRLALLSQAACARLGNVAPLARGLHFSDLGKVISFLGPMHGDVEHSAPAANAGLGAKNSEPSAMWETRWHAFTRHPSLRGAPDEPAFPVFGLTLGLSWQPGARRADLTAEEANQAWRSIERFLSNLGAEILPAATYGQLASSEDPAKPYDYERDRRVHQGVFGMLDARANQRELAQDIGLPSLPSQANRAPSRAPRSL